MTDISHGLNLLFENEGGVQSPSMNVGWCISKEIRKELANSEHKDFYILLIVVDENHREYRYLKPLDRGRTLIHFDRAGPHEIHASIVAHQGGIHRLEEVFLMKCHYNRTYDYNSMWNGKVHENFETVNGTKTFIVTHNKNLDDNEKSLFLSLQANKKIVAELNKQVSDPSLLPAVAEPTLPDYIDIDVSDTSTELERTNKRLQVIKDAKKILKNYKEELEKLPSDPIGVRLNRHEEIIRRDEKELAEVQATPRKKNQREFRFDEANNGILGTGGDNTASYAYARREITIDSELFAPEPTPWVKEWVNTGYEARHRDECHFRRRAVWAFTGKPIVYGVAGLAIMFYRALYYILFGILIGTRRANLKPIIHPYKYSTNHIFWENPSQDDWVGVTKELKRRKNQYLLEPLRPLWIVAILALMLIARFISSLGGEPGAYFDGYSTLEFIAFGVMVLGGIILLLFAFFAYLYVVGVIVHLISEFNFGRVFKKIFSKEKVTNDVVAEVKRPTNKRRPKIVHQSPAFDTLVCDGNTTLKNKGVIDTVRSAPLSAVPVLLFEGIKSKICRPAQKI